MSDVPSLNLASHLCSHESAHHGAHGSRPATPSIHNETDDKEFAEEEHEYLEINLKVIGAGGGTGHVGS